MSGISKIIDLNAVWEGNLEAISYFFVVQVMWFPSMRVVLLKGTEQNINNQTLTKVSQRYVHVFFCLKVIRSWLNMPTGSHGHVIWMCIWNVQMKRCCLYNIWTAEWIGRQTSRDIKGDIQNKPWPQQQTCV